MRKTIFVVISLTVLVLAISIAWAQQREHDFTEVTFGESYHKDFGVHLNHLLAQWDEDGVNFVRYRVSPWKGLVTYRDMYIVNDGKVLYKRSADRQLNVDMHYHLTAKKFFEERAYLTPPIKPFTFDAGEIWWLFTYTQMGKKKNVAVVWNIKTNEITWKPLEGCE